MSYKIKRKVGEDYIPLSDNMERALDKRAKIKYDLKGWFKPKPNLLK